MKYKIICVVDSGYSKLEVKELLIQRAWDEGVLDMKTLSVKGRKLTVSTKDISSTADDLAADIENDLGDSCSSIEVTQISKGRVKAAVKKSSGGSSQKSPALTDKAKLLKKMHEAFPVGHMMSSPVGHIIFDTREDLSDILGW